MTEPFEHTILALIPAYNEALRVGGVVQRAAAYLPVLVVDDGSIDATEAAAKQAGAMVLLQKPNQGKGAALRAGFRRALEDGCEAVVTLDADGQHDPDEIPAFLRLYRTEKADLIIGERDFSKMPLIRRLANTLGGWLFSWGMGQSVRDNQSGYRLISRRLMEVLLESGERGFEFEVEMLLTAARRGMRVGWVPIRTIYAGETSHIRAGEHALNFMRMVWRARQSRLEGKG